MGLVQSSSGRAAVPASAPAVTTAPTVAHARPGTAAQAPATGIDRADSSRRSISSTSLGMPARDTRNTGRSPPAAARAASGPRSGNAAASRRAAARRSDAPGARLRKTRVSPTSAEPPHAGQRPSASGSGPPQSRHGPAPPTSSEAAAPGRASASSSAAAVGNRSSATAAVACATTSSSQAGTAGAAPRARNPLGEGVGGRWGDGRSGSSPVSA